MIDKSLAPGQLPPSETWYMWKDYASVDSEGGPEPPRLLTPWSDPMVYEHPMDWLFKTEQQALASKDEFAPHEDWVLVKVEITPVRVVCGRKLMDDYPDGVCPDCGEPIPDDAAVGSECDNCGHVFHYARQNDDETPA